MAEGYAPCKDGICDSEATAQRGSILFEVKTQLQLASELGFLQLMPDLTQLIDEVGKLITGLSKTLTVNR